MNPNIKFKKGSVMTLTFMAFALSVFSSCSNKNKNNTVSAEPLDKKAQAPVYQTKAVRYFNPEYTVSLPAEMKPYEQVEIYAKVEGFVRKLLVDRGSRVKKGQLLAVLEAPEMEQRFLSDKSSEKKLYSDYLFAKQAYDRLKEASETEGAVAAIELDRAQTEMESAESAYQASKAQTSGTGQMKKYLRITAPFDGVIMDRGVSVGALTGKGNDRPLFMLAQKKKLRLTLSLPEKQAASAYEGMPATFTVSSQPGQKFEARLSRTSGLLNLEDRSLKLEFDVDNPEGKLQGGDYAQVTLKLKRSQPTFWVPAGSILNNQLGSFVFTVEKNKIKRVPVLEGTSLDSLTEVFGALQKEDSVILKPSQEINALSMNP